MAFVIGKRAQYVEEADAFGHVAGYAVLNDVSERQYQLEQGGQWVKGKSFDRFAPPGTLAGDPRRDRGSAESQPVDGCQRGCAARTARPGP